MADITSTRITLAHEPPFQLGVLEIFPAIRQVARAGNSETLEPRIMQVLVALAHAGGAVVTRDDLIARCWGGQVVGDNAIQRAISRLRELSVGLGSGTFRVDTITKVGYRLRLDGVPALPDGQAANSQGFIASPHFALPAIPASTPRRFDRRWLIGAGAASAAGLLLVRPRRDAGQEDVAALLARGEAAMRDGLPDSDAQGAGFFEEAARLAPRDAEIWGKLALARQVMAENAPPERVARFAAASEDAAARALAINGRNADARAALALLPDYFGDWLAAERRMNAVLALDPEHLAVRDARAFMWGAVGRMRESARDRLRIAPRDPLSAIEQFRLVYAFWFLDRLTEADRAANRAMSLWPRHPAVWHARLYTLALTGRIDRALGHLDDAAIRPPLPPPLLAAYRAATVALGSRHQADADKAGEQFLGLFTHGPTIAVAAIMFLVPLGKIDTAFAIADAFLLERGSLMAQMRWQEGQVSVNDQHHRKTNMLFVPSSAPMRSDSRFLPLMQAIGLTEYWATAGVTPDFLVRAATTPG